MARSNLLETADNGRANMGMSFGLGANEMTTKRSFRWLFSIPQISDRGVDSLPPRKAGRPGLTFKEQDCQHLSELVYFPVKADWKPVNIVLYDIRCNKNPVFDWLKTIYTVGSTDKIRFLKSGVFKKKEANLELYDGCGNVVEAWNFENVFPNSIDFGDLDMDSSEIIVCNLTIRYDRAYMVT